MNRKTALITTLGEKCKVCYTCVRDCPAKAIRIAGGQAEVIIDRCIGCGNCVRVCSQNAKQYHSSIIEMERLLGGDGKVAAIVAPSFPAEFDDLTPGGLVARIRDMGFDFVCEVSFGADIVASQYKKMISENVDNKYIASTCPSIVSYIEKYHPDLTGCIAPIVSPMLATARALRHLHGKELKVVFIGPCIAKKVEATRFNNGELEVNAVLTFTELRDVFSKTPRLTSDLEESTFDPPHPGLGALFALSGGMLQAADIEEDLLSTEVLCADGKNNFVEAINEFENGAFSPKLLEVLCCNGCIRGSGMSTKKPYFTRRTAVSKYVRQRIRDIEKEEREACYEKLTPHLDLTCAFKADDLRLPMPSKEELDSILFDMGKYKPEDELDCEACGYKTCREHAIAIHKGLAESEMCLPNTIDRLKKSLTDLNVSNHQLERTKQALFNAEKLASMGQLSAGIAHEINNPLGVILLNSNLLLEDLEENSEEHEDLKLIVEQAERCKKIVSGLLNFARKNKVVLQPTNIKDLVGHCLKSILNVGKVKIDVTYEIDDPFFDLDKDQIIQVLTNLIVNAIEAMPGGGNISISVSDSPDKLTIAVEDTGQGISKSHIHKIFEPLFTTKQMGKGTGLGLAVTYGIIKMHRGFIEVESNSDPNTGPTGTKFKVTIPRKGNDS